MGGWGSWWRIWGRSFRGVVGGWLVGWLGLRGRVGLSWVVVWECVGCCGALRARYGALGLLGFSGECLRVLRGACGEFANNWGMGGIKRITERPGGQV